MKSGILVGTALAALVVVAFLMPGCTASQDQAYIQQVQGACNEVLPMAESLPVAVVASASVIVSDVQKAVVGFCGTADGLSAIDAKSLAWLGTTKTVLSTGGAVLPPPP